MAGGVWIGFILLVCVLAVEMFAPKVIAEGFQQMLGEAPVTPTPQRTDMLSNLIKARGDVGIGHEINGWAQDRRYFAGYADVQRYGVKKDFCRVVTLSGEEGTMFACALAGTATTSPYQFRTKTAKQGFRYSRDDYLRNVLGDGRDAYCRILKFKDGSFQPMCLRATDTGFDDVDFIDSDPPEQIKTLLDFYSGCELWFRFRDDMVDTIGRTKLQFAGNLKIDETPRPTITRGLSFNGRDQFLRFGDLDDLSLGNIIKLRTMRAFSVWVYFDEFTNNAHIFDFGNGAGRDNIFLGILGKGETGDDPAALRPPSKCPETTIPERPAGAQWCAEIRPQELLEEDPAQNPDSDLACVGQSVFARKLDRISTQKPEAPPPTSPPSRATLIYEVWDKTLRKVQVKINRAVPLQKWAHIVVTAANTDALRPDLQFWVNGNLLYVHEQGFLPPAKTTSHNYLGKSNWANDSSEYELRDELFAGSLFDFRVYRSPLSETKIKRILQWGMGMLGLDDSFRSVTG